MAWWGALEVSLGGACWWISPLLTVCEVGGAFWRRGGSSPGSYRPSMLTDVRLEIFGSIDSHCCRLWKLYFSYECCFSIKVFLSFLSLAIRSPRYQIWTCRRVKI